MENFIFLCNEKEAFCGKKKLPLSQWHQTENIKWSNDKSILETYQSAIDEKKVCVTYGLRQSFFSKEYIGYFLGITQNFSHKLTF